MSKSIVFDANETTLQTAACILRNEFQKKEDWYNALVASIVGYIRDMPEGQWDIDLAKGIADRIIGLEETNGSN